MSETFLISGATGFIASHTIDLLLQQGFNVIGTCRDPNNLSATQHLLDLPGAKTNLTLVPADLLNENAFDQYTGEADYVLHMASPFAVTVKNPERDLVTPAVNGTKSMLSAASKSSRVKRVVVTSSMAAITDEPDGNHILTESDWNTKSSLTRNPYYYSKVLAERAAWDFHSTEKPRWSLVTINPFLVIGPSMTNNINESNKVLFDIINGKFPAIMSLAWGFVDVRDVAFAHLQALVTPNAAGRYLCAAETRTMREVVTLLRENGYSQAKLPKISFESALGQKIAYLASYSQPKGVATYLRTHLGRRPNYDNKKIVADLGIDFRSVDQSILDTCADGARWGHIKSYV